MRAGGGKIMHGALADDVSALNLQPDGRSNLSFSVCIKNWLVCISFNVADGIRVTRSPAISRSNIRHVR